jgi:hypothetical protein
MWPRQSLVVRGGLRRAAEATARFQAVTAALWGTQERHPPQPSSHQAHQAGRGWGRAGVGWGGGGGHGPLSQRRPGFRVYCAALLHAMILRFFVAWKRPIE